MHQAIYNRFLPALLLVLVISSCATTKKGTADIRLPKVKESVLIERLNELASKRPNFFYTKMSAKFKDDNNNVSFKTSLRMRVDSALQATITFASIPIYNAMITPDSLTLVDKRSSCFIRESIDFFKDKFHVDFKHKNIEELILGMPVLWEKDESYRQLKDPYNYVVTSAPKKGHLVDKDIVVYYFMDDTAENLEKVYIESPQDSSHIEIHYLDHQLVSGYSVPTDGDITITTPKGKTFIGFKYGKVSINEPRILYLSIPSKYEECE